MHQIITISGTPGSGKSTIAKNLVPIFNAERIYTGGLWREMAKEKNMTLEEFHQYASKHHEVDQELDEKVATEARRLAKEKNVIVEGRVQYLFLPESIKIFVKADLSETAKRVFKEMHSQQDVHRKDEMRVSSLDDIEEKQRLRRAVDIERYKEIYKIDYTDESQYDFILDTTHLSIEESAQKTADFINKNLK